MTLFKKVVFATIFSLSIFSCNPLKKIESGKMVADEAFAKKEYTQAYNLYNNLISNYQKNNLEVPADVYLKAAESADEIGNSASAVGLYESALSQAVTVQGVKGLIKSLKVSSQNANAAEALTKYESFLIEKGEGEYVNVERFNNVVSLGNQEGILTAFKKINSPTEDQAMIYVNALDGMGRKKEAVKFCNDLIKENPAFYKAREYKAIYYYNFAEDWYKNEMAKYNKDKNYTAYVYLKRELKKISANYRVAKIEFESLHKAKPSDRKYIKYLKNTYIRLEMKKEAEAMNKLLK